MASYAWTSRLEQLEPRRVLAPVPVVGLTVPAETMIGEQIDFNVSFDNQATGAPTVGYAPYVDLFVDVTGTDGVSPGSSEPTDFDGFSNLSASFLGASIAPIQVTLGAGGTYTHPLARDIAGDAVTGTAPVGFNQGDVLYVLQLPFGSFVDAQTVADIAVTATVSAEADLDVPLNLAAQGGFRYGSDPSDNPTTDPSILGAVDSATTTPKILRLFKEYIGAEDETATGPNFPRQYRIRADIADGQTITDLRLIDFLPNDMAFNSVVSTSPAGTTEQTPTAGSAQNAPNNDLVVLFSSVTGGTSDDDANVVFEFYTPDVDANAAQILGISSGDDDTTLNDAQATGTWDPTDPSDAVESLTVVDEGNDNHTLTNKSIAIQKSGAITNEAGFAGPSPGDIVTYTLDFQVSDYFTFGDIVVEDIISDGQRLAGSPGGPYTGQFTLSVTDRNGTVSGTFPAANITVDESQFGNDTNPATDGSTRIVFDVSSAMVALGGADGIMQGGRAIAADSVGAVGTITYEAEIQQSFTDSYPSGQSNVDQGDVLDNAVTITGSIRNNASIASTIGTESDTSSESLEIVTGNLLKTTYAVNGTIGTNDPTVDPTTGLTIGPSYVDTLEVRPGDEITYRLRYALPTGDVEDFRITDFLPLPVYNIAPFSTVLDTTVSAAAPTAESAKYGPDHTFSGATQHPTLSTDTTANSLEFDFGSYTEPPPEVLTVVDLLLTVTISDQPMANGLLLTNQAEAAHGTTNAGLVELAAITQITLTEPELDIRKGIVSTSNSAATYSATVAPTGISFEAPGLSTPASVFSGGTINSTNLGLTLNANVTAVDADDLVKFAIVIENEGESSAGAFDIQIRDSLPSGFSIPATGAGLNLEVFDGSGAAMGFTTIGTGLFDAAGGIELTDPGPTSATTIGTPPVLVDAGALDEFDATDGRNIAIVTFDLQVDSNVVPQQTTNLLNTATVFNYAGSEGGPDHTDPTDLTDTAQTTIATPGVAKSLVSTDITTTNNANNQATIGEIVTYDLVVTVPEGSMPSATIVDTLDNGLAFIDVVSFTNGSGALTIPNPIGTGSNPSNGVITNSGTTVTFNLGNVTNSDTDNNTDETFTIRYRAVVLNIGLNQDTPATNLTNSAVVSWTGGTTTAANAPTVELVEPLLQVAKTASSSTADAFDTITYTVTLSHAANSTDAHDVVLTDIVPSGLSYVPGSWTNTLGTVPDSTSDTAGTLTASFASFPATATSTFEFDVTISGGVQAGQTITNTASAAWTSLAGTTLTDISSYNTNSRERTSVGGVNDYSESGSADVTVIVPTTKSLVSTSEASTTTTDVAVGEIVRYKLAAQIPESTSPTFQLIDQLPDGLQFLDDGTAALALVSNGTGLTSSTLGAGFAITGTASSVTPTQFLPASAISGGPFSSGTDPTFSLGTLTNSDNDADSEFVVIEFNAIVTNTATNFGGSTLDNDFLIFVDGAQVGAASPSTQITVLEPSITDVTKSTLTPASGAVDAGQTVTYSVTYSNSNAATSTTAFDARLLDTLPGNLQSLSNVRVLRNSTLLASGFTNSSTASVLDVTLDQVAAGDAIEIRYDAVVANATTPGATINNTAELTYTTLPGGTGTATNATGSTAGTAGATDGERTGAGSGENDLLDSDGATATVNSHTISGFVYHDENNNGLFDEAATEGIATVNVRLVGTDHLGAGVDITLPTDGNGAYSFTGLRPGSYTVTEAQPGGYLNGQDTLGSPVFSATNTGRYDDSLGTFVIPVGTASSVSANNNFGELLPGEISGFVYIDANNDGLRGAETGIASILMSLSGIDDQGNTVTASTSTSGATGAYSFGNLRPGTYTVTEVSQPSNLLDGLETRGNTTALAGTADGTDTISGIVVVSDQTTPNNNFGEVPPGRIEGQVFRDANDDGSLNGSDIGLSGIAVNLTGTDVHGNVVSRSTNTAADGTYFFDNVMEGTYAVSEPTQPSEYFDGKESLEGVLIANSNASDQITPINLPVGGTSSNNDFAEVPDVRPQGYVYIDANQNGVRDSGEPGIPGVQITLTGIGNDVFGNPIPSRNAFTDANGFYQFTGITPGTYTITELHPASFQDGQEQNGTPAAATVNDDQFVGIPLTDTGPAGDYNFGEISPTGSISGQVYVDTNNNGVRDPGEVGLAGVTVTLVNDNDLNTLHTVVSDVNGFYRFVKLFPGSYRLIQRQPINFIDGQDTAGSTGGQVSNNRIDFITLDPDENAVAYNFGETGIDPTRVSKRMFLTATDPNTAFTGPAGSGVAAVGATLADPAGYVYVDIDRNGERDYGEPGIEGVLMTLSGVATDGTIIEYQARTDRDGFYQFAYLPSGVYSVSQSQPVGYDDGAESLGSLGGVVGDDIFSQIVLQAGDLGVDYNFGEYVSDEPVLLGDSNQDGLFNSSDLIVAFQSGEYEDDVLGNSSFYEGDWNGDGDFTSRDLVDALQTGSYLLSAIDALFAELPEFE